MDSDGSAFLSRDDLVEGLPARRASTLLFAIESRTAREVLRARQANKGVEITESDDFQQLRGPAADLRRIME